MSTTTATAATPKKAASKKPTAKKTPAKKPAAKKTPAKPKPAKVTIPPADALAALGKYLDADGTTDFTAPVERKPFVHRDRVYFTVSGLAKHSGLNQRALTTALNATHEPFSVLLDGKKTTVSHFWIDAKKVPGAKSVKPRESAREAKAAAKS